MIFAAIAFFSLSAILGMMLLVPVLKGRHTSKAVVFTHGPLAVVGLILLAIYATNHSPEPIESIVLFLIAATGGIIMVVRDLSGKIVPKWLAVGHGLIAAAGLVALLVFQCNL